MNRREENVTMRAGSRVFGGQQPPKLKKQKTDFLLKPQKSIQPWQNFDFWPNEATFDLQNNVRINFYCL
jgi:hypothetical protein